MKRVFLAGLCLLALPVAALSQPARIEVRNLSVGGSLSEIEIDLVSGSYEISFTAVGDIGMVVAVEVTANNSESIRWVRVKGRKGVRNHCSVFWVNRILEDLLEVKKGS